MEGPLTSTEEVNSLMKRKRERKKKKRGKAVEHKDEGPEFSVDNSSLKTDVTLEDPLHESQALTNFPSSQGVVEFSSTKKMKKKKKQKTEHNAIESNSDGCPVPKDAFSSKTSMPALDMASEPPIRLESADPFTRGSHVESDICQEENEEKEQTMLKKAKDKSNGESDNSSLKTDVTLEDPLHESQALTNFPSSQGVVEFSSTKKMKKKKKQKTEHNAFESNSDDCPVPKDAFSSKSSMPALDMASEPPIRLESADPLTRGSHVESDICQEENEEKEQNMLKKAKDNSNGESDVQEVSCSRNSVVGNAECFAKEPVLDVGNLNIEQVINDSSSNPENKSSVKNASLAKNHDDYPKLHDFSESRQHAKTYKRRKRANSNYGRNSGYSSPVNCGEGITMQHHHKDDSQFCEGPSTVGLLEIETKCSRDKVTSNSGAAAEEMTLMTENPSKQISITTSSVADIPGVQLEEANGRQPEHAEITRNDMCCAGDVSDLSLVSIKDGHSKISQFSLGRTITSNSKKKLLILDVNGLLADFVSFVPRGFVRQPDLCLKTKKVFKRPFCEDFLQFCFDRFHVGIWSSRAKSNVDKVVKLIMGESASKLLFCWDQSHCTRTKFTTVENKYKPLVLKELRKLWEKLEFGLPWEKGEFNESNTLLLDDSPYKALLNPRYTAVFPYSYEYNDAKDASLGPEGDLRVYLEGLAMADNVQDYVSSNPFGQRAITESNASWVYYRKVIEAAKRRQYARRPSSPGRERNYLQNKG